MSKKDFAGILIVQVILMIVCYVMGRNHSFPKPAPTEAVQPASMKNSSAETPQKPAPAPTDPEGGFSIQDIAMSDEADELVVEMYEEKREEVVWATADWLSYKKTVRGFTGGAHGFYDAQYGTLNRKTGRRLSLADIAPKEKIPELTLAIRKALVGNFKKCDQFKGTTYEELRKMLLEDAKPTENFYYDDQGLHFSYGEYEIAAFAYSSYCADVCISWPLISLGKKDAVSHANHK